MVKTSAESWIKWRILA